MGYFPPPVKRHANDTRHVSRESDLDAILILHDVKAIGDPAGLCLSVFSRRHFRPLAVRVSDGGAGLLAAAGRVLAERVLADRDYPPFARSSRDGFAVRAADLPGALQVIGEVRAGEKSTQEVGAGQAEGVMAILGQNGLRGLAVYRDLAGFARVVRGVASAPPAWAGPKNMPLGAEQKKD